MKPADYKVRSIGKMDVVRVSAVVLRDAQRRVLTVRKHGTSAFMFPGGKPEQGETDAAAVIRECREELDAALDETRLLPLGTFEAAAANTPIRSGRRLHR